MDLLQFLHARSSTVLPGEDTLLPLLSHVFSGKACMSSCSFKVEVSSERCSRFWLWRALWRSLHPWSELCPPTTEQQTWGFFSCHLLPESCMHIPLLLLKCGEVRCLCLAPWTVESAGHQLLSALQTPNQVAGDV